MHAVTVAQASPKFRLAVQRGDAAEALRLGRKVMFACQEQIRVLGEQAAKTGWASRVGLVPAPVDTQQVAHYEAISQQVSLVLQGLGLYVIDEDAQCLDPEDARRATDIRRGPLLRAPSPTRALDVERIHGELNHVSSLMTAVAEIVRRADPAVEALRRQLDDLAPNIHRAEDALLRHYVVRPTSSSGIVACCTSNPGSAVACCLCGVTAFLCLFAT